MRLGATNVALGTSPYVGRIGTLLQRAKAANDLMAETPLDSRTRANYVETFREIVSYGTELQTRAATGEAETKATAGDFKADYEAFVGLVNEFVKAANSQEPAPPPVVAPRVAESLPSDLPAPSTAIDWTPWLIGAGVLTVGGLGFYGYKKGWFKRRGRR